jgi:hypothetical protein
MGLAFPKDGKNPGVLLLGKIKARHIFPAQGAEPLVVSLPNHAEAP